MTIIPAKLDFSDSEQPVQTVERGTFALILPDREVVS